MKNAKVFRKPKCRARYAIHMRCAIKPAPLGGGKYDREALPGKVGGINVGGGREGGEGGESVIYNLLAVQ